MASSNESHRDDGTSAAAMASLIDPHTKPARGPTDVVDESDRCPASTLHPVNISSRHLSRSRGSTAPFRRMETQATESERERAREVPTAPAERLTFTIDEVAATLGISRSSAYECAKRGEIPTVRFGRRIVVPRRAVLALLGETAAES
jgi:excisionase family DNA binding protein